MQYNIPLLRSIHRAITECGWQFDQTVQRFRDKDGVRMDLYGWAIELDGRWRFIGDEKSFLNSRPFGCVQVQHPVSREIKFIDQVGPDLMGVAGEEAAYLFGASYKQTVSWLEDVLAAHDTKVLDALDAELDFGRWYLDDEDFPLGEVRG
ncbi:hypothetical protein [Nocardia brasiliensis]|uniref:hypothetical protein n=1 Tax=Nocardia brasiliensis TaxID=37326 RepID=UPI0024589BC3|nr:hypothetical protein [Nocardia brasiliensis]